MPGRAANSIGTAIAAAIRWSPDRRNDLRPIFPRRRLLRGDTARRGFLPSSLAKMRHSVGAGQTPWRVMRLTSAILACCYLSPERRGRMRIEAFFISVALAVLPAVGCRAAAPEPGPLVEEI